MVLNDFKKPLASLLGSTILGTAAIVYGWYKAYGLHWLCDDAFITFRYADNYLAGLGFVFNAGERVEGYTHFLWLCVITFFQWLGVSPEASTISIGLSAYVATMVLFLWLSFKIGAPNSFTIPFVAIALALHYDFWIWATGGLETSLFTFLISLGVVVACFIEAKPATRFFCSGLIFVLGALTRPDGIVFWGMCLLFLACCEFADGKRLRLIVRLAWYYVRPFLALYLPYAVWKVSYYGDILPNTYYAKSAGVSYFKQGLFYIWTYIQGYSSTWLVLLIIPFLVQVWRKSSGVSFRERIRGVLSNTSVKAALLATLLIIGYGSVFVARVGGDFMYARFLHVLIPLLYLVIGISLVGLFGHKQMFLNLSMLAIFILIVDDRTRRDDYLADSGAYEQGGLNTLSGITDEHWYWTHDLGEGEDLTQFQSRLGKELRTVFEGTDVTVVLRGQNNFAYYGKFRTCIENSGLTDYYIAHLPLEHRGKPGHEKTAPWEYLVARHAHFVFLRPATGLAAFRTFSVICGRDSIWAHMITYDRELLRDLDQRFPGQVSYTNFEEYLDSYIGKMKNRKYDEVRADYKVFDDYYFRWVNDEKRRNIFRAFFEGQTSTPGSG